MGRRWFKPKKRTGWRKNQKPPTRRRKLLESTSKRKSLHDRYVEAARRAQALANVTRDAGTRRAAQADANYFFRRARETK